MKNQDAKWILKEIDSAVARRKRPLFRETLEMIDLIRTKIQAGFDFDKNEEKILLAIYEKLTDPKRIKWGCNARPA
jgi:hypothetical protein